MVHLRAHIDNFNGEYSYAYDAVGSRTAYTTTITGTTVITYHYDAANRLLESVEVGGETTTYNWDDVGRLITTTVGTAVSRIYTYSQSGDLTVVLANNLLTTFVYDGNGRRLQMSVAGEVVTYTLDYARGFRVLLEEGGAFSDTKHYLYGLECIAELVDADESDSEWRYYHQDGNHLVRQTTNMAATVTLAWTYSPEGAILLGEEGPVTHLGCDGNTIYDFTTGLIFKKNNYFDPNTGIWITLSGMVVWNGWQSRPGNGRQRKRSRKWLLLLLLFLIVLALTGCGGTSSTPTPTPTETPCPPTVTPGVPTVPPSNKMYAFMDSEITLPDENQLVTKSWETHEREVFDSDINAIISRLIQSDGFGTISKLQAELGVSSSKPILLARVDAHPQRPTAGMGTFNPYILVYDRHFLGINGQSEAFRRGLIVHEFAHLWDQNHGHQLSAGMQKFVNWGEWPTRNASDSPGEDFSETFAIYFYPEHRSEEHKNNLWTDDSILDSSGINLSRGFQRAFYLAAVSGGSTIPASDSLYLNPNNLGAETQLQGGDYTLLVRDRFDWIEQNLK